MHSFLEGESLTHFSLRRNTKEITTVGYIQVYRLWLVLLSATLSARYFCFFFVCKDSHHPEVYIISCT